MIGSGASLWQTILRRLAAGVVVLWVVSVLLFAAVTVLPGDPATRILGPDATPANVSALREQLDLDRPAVERYFSWLGGLVRGDAGQSVSRQPVSDMLSERIVNSFALAAAASLIALTLALVVGVAAGLRASQPADTLLSVATLIGISVPDFVVAGLLVSLFAFTLEWFPPVSLLLARQSVFEEPKILVLPAVALAIPSGAWASRYVRAAVVDIRHSASVEAARLAGLSPARVLIRHILPGIIGQTAQVLAAATAFMVGGAVVVEQVFAYPGLGSLLAGAVAVLDVSVILATGLVMAGTVIVAFLLADVVAVLADPRLRKSRE